MVRRRSKHGAACDATLLYKVLRIFPGWVGGTLYQIKTRSEAESRVEGGDALEAADDVVLYHPSLRH
jgi:hypothetical protein